MKKVLVLGGAGFIGKALLAKLKGLHFEVTAVDRVWKSEFEGIECVTGDVFDEVLLSKVMEGQDMVFHLVSTTVPAISNDAPKFDCISNVGGTLNILDAMVANHVGKIVFTSSGGTVYGVPEEIPIAEDAPNFPICAYGISKLSIEKYMKLYSYLHGIEATVLRLSNPFGPGQDPEKGQGVIATFIQRALDGKEIEIWGDGTVVRDFVYIDDVIDAFILASQLKKGFTLLNIGQGEGKSLKSILKVIECELKCDVSVTFKPSRPCDVPKVVLDVRKARQVLGWEPKHSFNEGVKKFITHLT